VEDGEIDIQRRFFSKHAGRTTTPRTEPERPGPDGWPLKPTFGLSGPPVLDELRNKVRRIASNALERMGYDIPRNCSLLPPERRFVLTAGACR